MMSLHSQEVTVERLNLIEILKKNREVHATEYKEAVVGFHVEALRAAEQHLANIKAFELFEDKFIKETAYHYIRITPPQDHTKEYNDVIEMLEMSVDENIRLDSQAFRAYVKDEWTWSAQTKMLNSSYAELAGSARRN